MKRLIYVAHPLGSNPLQRFRNLDRAEAWRRWVGSFDGLAAIAPWIEMARQCSEDMRDRGLQLDRAVVGVCDEVWLCGERVSPGMAMEAGWAFASDTPVWDLTHLGYLEPPPPNVQFDPTWPRFWRPHVEGLNLKPDTRPTLKEE